MTVRSHTASLVPWLRLCRVGTLFSPAADVVAGACIAGIAWDADLVSAALASVLVYAAGMVLNDHADRREDAVLRPERPIPSGRIAPGAAAALGAVLLVAGVMIAPWPLWWAGLAALVLAYDYLLKARIALAAPTMGVLRGLNLLGGAAFAAQAFPDARAVLLPALAYALYVLSVTVLGHYEDVRNVAPRAVIGVQSLPPLVGVLGLLPLPDGGVAAAIGAGLAALFLRRMRRVGTAWDRAAIRGSMTWLLLGTMAFTALVCVGAGRPVEALGIAAAIPIARSIARRVALT